MERPFVHVNLAVSADGRVADDAGRPVAISCAEDWRRVHLLRESYDAVAVGARTWIGDRPRLTVRPEVLGREPCRQPARVIFAGSQCCEIGPAADRRTFVVGRVEPGRDAVHVPAADRKLAEVLAALRGHGVRSLLVEGGPTLLRSFLDQGCSDRLTVYVPTTDVPAARRAVGRALAELPELAADPFGRGLLFDLPARPPAVVVPRVHDPAVAQLLAGRLVYLDPDAAGVPNGGRRGDRLALVGPVPLPLTLAGVSRRFRWYVFARLRPGETVPAGPLANSVLVYGELGGEPPLVRLHSGCHTGDVFGSLRCDCGPQLEQALAEITAAGAGVVVYVTEHEGRGIGLWSKALAYLLQEAGHDTYEANRRLGLPDDARRFTDAAVVLAHLLGRRRVRLLSNNPKKCEALAACGFEVVEMRGLLAGHHEVNRRYLETKARHGHLLPGAGDEPPWTR